MQAGDARQLAQADSRSLTAVFSQVLLETLHVGNGEADGRDFRDVVHGLLVGLAVATCTAGYNTGPDSIELTTYRSTKKVHDRPGQDQKPPKYTF